MYGSYSKLMMDSINCDAGQQTAIALEAAAGVKFTWSVKEPITVTRFGISPTVLFVYDTMTVQSVVKLKKYIVYGSSAGEVVLATITLDDPAVAGNNAWAAGHIYYVDVSNLAGVADIDAGEQLVVEVTTQGAGGTELGDWLPYIGFNHRAEVAANQSYMHNIT